MHPTAAPAPKGMQSTTSASDLSRSVFPATPASPREVTKAPIRKATVFAGEILALMQELVIESVTGILPYCALLWRIVTTKRSSGPSKLFIRTDLVFPPTLGVT